MILKMIQGIPVLPNPNVCKQDLLVNPSNVQTGLRLSNPFLNQPLIQGYYGPLYTDVESETEAARPSYREYFIIFEPQAGVFTVRPAEARVLQKMCDSQHLPG